MPYCAWSTAHVTTPSFDISALMSGSCHMDPGNSPATLPRSWVRDMLRGQGLHGEVDELVGILHVLLSASLEPREPPREYLGANRPRPLPVRVACSGKCTARGRGHHQNELAFRNPLKQALLAGLAKEIVAGPASKDIHLRYVDPHARAAERLLQRRRQAASAFCPREEVENLHPSAVGGWVSSRPLDSFTWRGTTTLKRGPL